MMTNYLPIKELVSFQKHVLRRAWHFRCGGLGRLWLGSSEAVQGQPASASQGLLAMASCLAFHG